MNIAVFIASCCILHTFGGQFGKHNPMSESAEKYEYIHQGSSKTVIIAETCLDFQWSSLCRSVLKVWMYDHPGPSENYDYSWDVLQFAMIIPMSERAEKYNYIHPGPSKSYDCSWDVLQFQMIILCRSVRKSMHTSIQDHIDNIGMYIYIYI